MRKSAKYLLIVLGALMFVFASFMALLIFSLTADHQDYAVNRREAGLTCATFYPSERQKNPDYDFTTIVFPENCDTPEDYGDGPVVVLSHLAAPTCPNCDQRRYQFKTTVQVHNGGRTSWPIVPGSLRITHYIEDESQPLIPDKTTQPDVRDAGFYEQFYLPQKLPERLFERVRFKVIHQGRTIDVDRVFTLYLTDHYDGLDVLGGV